MTANSDKIKANRPYFRYGVMLSVAVVLAACGVFAWAGHSGLVGHHGIHGQDVREHVRFRMGRALGEIKASEAQAEQAEAILEQFFADHEPLHQRHDEMHEQLAALLTAEEIDRDRLESLRLEQLQEIDRFSRDLVDTVADLAEVLTPEQRQQLADWHQSQVE